MKHLLVISVILTLFLANDSYGQDNERTSSSEINNSTLNTKGSLEFRAHLGINISYLPFTSYTSSRTGYDGAVGLAYYFTPTVKVRSGLEYQKRSYAEGSVIDRVYSYDYLTLPALFEYQKRRFSLFAGPHFGAVLKAERGGENAVTFDLKDRTETFTVGLLAGLGFDITQSSTRLRLEGFIQVGEEYIALGTNLVLLF